MAYTRRSEAAVGSFDRGNEIVRFHAYQPDSSPIALVLLEPSPYLPRIASFFNVTYIRPQDIAVMRNSTRRTRPKWRVCTRKSRQPNDSIESLDINSARRRQALQLGNNVPRSVERQAAFDAFKEAAGPDLRVRRMVGGVLQVGRRGRHERRDEPRFARSGGVSREHVDMVDFECWPGIADEQVDSRAETSPVDSGGTRACAGQAVGVHPRSARTWW